ncbi:putative pentatricopeptide repeat-containing protein At3g01580 isoform X2 [Rhodamnia argentea]|uniref:Pentatricopeptide repeat-containing protein At3g01580 isoform X2 n=1 Tax=Rhodamnia argentea TaxID=178133 RepID=A0A8B8NGF9_9MYRT|nr:putative pentatricopeptide repeat-containing protein At3g01580 isoform X2 [Rhodamnia argentea]
MLSLRAVSPQLLAPRRLRILKGRTHSAVARPVEKRFEAIRGRPRRRLVKPFDSSTSSFSLCTRKGLMEDVRVATSLVDFYCKCGLVEDAWYVFDRMTERDVVSWNTMINGYVGVDDHEEAISVFLEMGRQSVKPSSRTVVALLLACGEAMELRMGQELHCYSLRSGLFHEYPHVGTALIGFYAKFNVKVSHNVFDTMEVKNMVSWNANIMGYFEAGDYLMVLKLFVRILENGGEVDEVTMLIVIQACTEHGSLGLAMQIHQMAIKSELSCDVYLANALLHMYSKLQKPEFAYEVFKSVPTCDVVLWNSMLSTYIDFSCPEEAQSLFLRMLTEDVEADERTIILMLSSCADLADGMRFGRSLHAHVIKAGMLIDVSLGNALLNMYEETNCIEAVKKAFTHLPAVDVVSWNTLIAALANSNSKVEALEIFLRMHESEIKPNSYTIISILASCDDAPSLNIGRSIHGYVIKQGIDINIPLNTALTEMYMDCGDEVTARNLFDCCSNKDIVSWNSLIASYIRNNQTHKALLLFRRLISETEPNSVTLINVLSSCIHLADLHLGQCIHAYITRRESSIGSDASLANALITMYAKCGSLHNGEKVFNLIWQKDVISWNAMIIGYGMHGQGEGAISTFRQMLEDGMKPNSATFVSILSACSHCGLIEEGLLLYNSMFRKFKVKPELIHYGCVVDLLGRGGHLDEALNFVNSMPIEADALVWRALLSACQVHSNTKLVKLVFEKIVELEPTNEGNYVLLSNIYAAAGVWSDVRLIRAWLKEKGLRKPPGISWIVIRNQAHVFTARDQSHPQTDLIYAILSSLSCSIKDAGYVSDIQWILLDEES